MLSIRTVRLIFSYLIPLVLVSNLYYYWFSSRVRVLYGSITPMAVCDTAKWRNLLHRNIILDFKRAESLLRERSGNPHLKRVLTHGWRIKIRPICVALKIWYRLTRFPGVRIIINYLRATIYKSLLEIWMHSNGTFVRRRNEIQFELMKRDWN